MFGMLGSLLGSVASGVTGMFGQSSANDAMLAQARNQYSWGVKDMMNAGLNPAAMYSGGGMSPAPMAPQQNTMAAMSGALKDAASSAVQMKVANSTIDKMADEMAKLKADAAVSRATEPGVAARSGMDVMKTDAIRKIPEFIRTPIFQGGFGAEQGAPAGKVGSFLGATGAVAGGAGDRYLPSIKIAPPDFSSAKAAVSGWYDKAKKEGVEWRDYLRDKFDLREKKKNETVIYKQ